MFRFLVGLADEAPIIVVLDEVQYLIGGEDDFASNLAAIWDRELRDRPIMLVLCGSEVGAMERLRSGDSPLQPRRDLLPQHGQRDGAVLEHLSVEVADVELLTELVFRQVSQAPDLDSRLRCSKGV